MNCRFGLRLPGASARVSAPAFTSALAFIVEFGRTELARLGNTRLRENVAQRLAEGRLVDATSNLTTSTIRWDWEQRSQLAVRSEAPVQCKSGGRTISAPPLPRPASADARSFWELCFGKLPADQLFNLTKDPDCITNLAGELPIRELEEQLFAELKAQQDPRIVGGPAFDNFPDASGGRGFYERWLKGQNVSHDWIFDSDFQPAPTAANGRE